MKLIRSFITVLILGITACTSTTNMQPPSPDTPTVMITGASRGIGFELARQYAELGWGVIATCRNPATADALQALAGANPNVAIEQLDVTDFDEMDALAARYKGVPIDVLINNAGILGGNDRQKFGSFDYTAFDEIMAVNVIGPIRMVELFVDNVAMSEQKKIINISSSVGSISMAFPGQNFYKASKSALNMSMKVISKELKGSKDPNKKQIVVGLIHPGVVRTEFAGDIPIPMIEPEDSAAQVIAVIENHYVSRRQSGDFMSYTGSKLPW
jgi:NAD(P)-dependent dehydrogenase (short-subunit alcohol dehydrogenase family)